MAYSIWDELEVPVQHEEESSELTEAQVLSSLIVKFDETIELLNQFEELDSRAIPTILIWQVRRQLEGERGGWDGGHLRNAIEGRLEMLCEIENEQQEGLDG